MKFFVLLSCIALTILSCGCTNPWMTNTGRSAIEQYLISATIERAVDSAGLMRYSGKKIFFDYNYLAPQVDKPYVQGMLEMELSKVGCIIVAKQEEADIMIQPLCGVPYTELTFAIPEIPLLKRFKRMAYGHFAFNVFNAKDRTPLATITNINSSAQYNNWVVMLVPFTSHNMDMKDTKDTDTVYEF